ncbi:hypothetical protein [Actinoplanes hulinensis]|nr:hypothetical protein [Actinoplanes hulinensis]
MIVVQETRRGRGGGSFALDLKLHEQMQVELKAIQLGPVLADQLV